MVSTVLYEKNGVLTEERFLKLTPIQWLFHYNEVMKERKREKQWKDDAVNAVLKTLECVGMLANSAVSAPDLAKKILEERSRKEFMDGVESGNDEMLKYYDDVVDKMPKTITVQYDTKDKFFLPKYKRDKRGKRKVGIDIKEVGE